MVEACIAVKRRYLINRINQALEPEVGFRSELDTSAHFKINYPDNSNGRISMDTMRTATKHVICLPTPDVTLATWHITS